MRWIAVFLVVVCSWAGWGAPGGSPPTAGRRLVVGVIHDPPYLVKGKDGGWSGLNMDVWRNVAKAMKVDYTLREVPALDIEEALRRGDIDISIDASYVLSDRAEKIDFSFPFGNARLAVATVSDRLHHPWWTALSIFFSWTTLEVAGTIALLLLALGAAIWFFERRSNLEHFGGSRLRGIGSGVYWAGSTMASGVCLGVPIKSFRARLLALLWMFLCALALSGLIASLTSSLFQARAVLEVVSDRDLQHMKLGGLEGSVESLVLKSSVPDFRLYREEEQALRAVLKGEVEGFLYDEITLHYYKDGDYLGQISVYPTAFRRFFFAFGLPKGSSIKEEVDRAIVDLLEKPDWPFLLKRYGLEEDYQEIPASPGRRRFRR